MKSLTKPTLHAYRNGNGLAALFFSLLAILFLGVALALASAGVPATVQASPSSPLGQPITQAADLSAAQPITPVATLESGDTLTQTQEPVVPTVTVITPSDSDAAQPVATAEQAPTGALPGSVQTPQFVPPVPTGASGEPIVPLTQPVPSVAAQNPNVNPGAQPGTSSPGGDFPWLPVGLLALAALVGAGFMLARNRKPVAATSNVYRVEDSAATTTVRDTTTSSAVGTGVAVTTASAAPIVGAGVAGAAAAGPRELTCPNCGTTNGIDENFCHDCGQDLRASRAALVTAAVAPPAAEAVVDIDTLPYLETLDRVDEQLEYVLSRPRVLIGTAQGNDIVINTDFMGYQSVSPVHAELRREPEGYLLRDRDSEQGTYVNDVRTGESLLADGDTFRLGGVRFVFRVPQGG